MKNALGWLGLALTVAACAEGVRGQKAQTAGFDGTRAHQHVTQIVGFGPRPAGSPALARTRQYITAQLEQAGVKVREQAFRAETPLGPIDMVNLIATIPGTSPDRLAFAGHYDTKLFRDFSFVGANDGGSSAGFLVELARVLAARQNAFTTEILFFDGEEAVRTDWEGDDNTYGSRHYVAAAQKDGTLASLKALILVDMIGDRDLRIRRESNSTPWLTDVIWASARRLKKPQFVEESGPIDDDHIPFLRAGVPAVDVIDLEYYDRAGQLVWHTEHDTLDKVSADSLQVVGDVLLDALPAIEKRLSAGASR
jgi:Zn-dependent M28 family amino/carboxypeptidase